MNPEKEIIVLGDIEIGAGNYTDDFLSDRTLSKLIIQLSSRKHPVDLVLNGDTFDFLKCPHFDRNKFTYTRHITAEISLNKLKLMHHAHKRVFQALKKFVSHKKNQLFFITGNHDYDLVYKKVQDQIKKLLGKKDNIFFALKYNKHSVYVEHGQQYDPLNSINYERLFLFYKGQQILNLPFVSLSITSKFLHMKEDHPFLERIFPRPALFNFNQSLIKKITRRSILHTIKSLFYYPFRYPTDPTYFFPKNLLREFYYRIRKVNWDVDSIINIFKRRQAGTKNKIYVLGHNHEKFVEDKKGQVIIRPGSWRDEYDLNPETKKLTPRVKRYVQILVNNGIPEYQLVDVHIKRSTFDIEKIIADETFYIRKAAKEEGFSSRFI